MKARGAKSGAQGDAASRRKARWFRVGAVVLGGLTALAALEVGLRIANPYGVRQRASWHFFLWDGVRPSADDERVWENVPGYRASLLGYDVAIDSLGLRGEELESPKGATTLRVLALGDSMTFGMSCPQADTYPAQLEQLLSAARPDRRVEVANAGVIAYTTLQEEEALRDLLPRLRPDVVVLWWLWNDTIATGAANPASQEEELYYLLGYRPKSSMTIIIHNVYRLLPCTAAFVRRAVQSGPKYETHHFGFYPEAAGEGWVLNRGALERIADHCRESGTPLLVFTFGRRPRIEAICAERGAAYACAVEEAGAEHIERYAVHREDGHFGREGNAVVAATVEAALEREFPGIFVP